jgi:hypothetical protein
LPLAVCLLLFPIPYYITHTSLRYRHPIDPFMVILTAYAITRFWDLLARLKVRRRGQFRESLIETAQPA